jgi:hypothetical protein
MSIIWGGRAHRSDIGLGNKMFLFFSAAIYSQKHDLNIRSDGKGPEKKIRDVVKIINLDKLYYKKEKPNRSMNLEILYKNDELIYHGDDTIYIFCNFYHNPINIVKNYDIIKQFIDLDFYRKDVIETLQNKYSVNDNDILCHIRLGDFDRNTLSPDYYTNILNNTFDKIYLIIYNPNNIEITEKYLTYFEKYKDKLVIILNNNIQEDFYMPYLFQNIIVSNSTFSWWSVFLNSNETKKIYIPKNGFIEHQNSMFKTSNIIDNKIITRKQI